MKAFFLMLVALLAVPAALVQVVRFIITGREHCERAYRNEFGGKADAINEG